MPEDLAHLDPQTQQFYIKVRAAWMMSLGTALVLIFSGERSSRDNVGCAWVARKPSLGTGSSCQVLECTSGPGILLVQAPSSASTNDTCFVLPRDGFRVLALRRFVDVGGSVECYSLEGELLAREVSAGPIRAARVLVLVFRCRNSRPGFDRSCLAEPERGIAVHGELFERNREIFRWQRLENTPRIGQEEVYGIGCTFVALHHYRV